MYLLKDNNTMYLFVFLGSREVANIQNRLRLRPICLFKSFYSFLLYVLTMSAYSMFPHSLTSSHSACIVLLNTDCDAVKFKYAEHKSFLG